MKISTLKFNCVQLDMLEMTYDKDSLHQFEGKYLLMKYVAEKRLKVFYTDGVTDFQDVLSCPSSLMCFMSIQKYFCKLNPEN